MTNEPLPSESRRSETSRARRWKWIPLSLLGLFALQAGSYLALSSARLPAIALSLTPEHMHFVKGTNFAWVLLRMEEMQGLSASEKERLLRLFRSTYNTVYTSESEVPESVIQRDLSGHLMGYNGGFSYTFRVISRGLFWARVGHSDWEGSEAASSGDHIYVWILGFWIKIHDGSMIMS